MPNEISGRINPILFSLFFLSGFCSLLYQLVWVRIAFAHFGVITPVLSVVLSVFMLGLGVGSVLGGAWAQSLSERYKISPALFYGGAELLIGVGAFVAPLLFQAGDDYLLAAGEASSTGYLFVSAIFIAVAILPWCIMMGATLPLMMSFIRQINPSNQNSFSFLYLANVVGATAGTLVTALVLVELLGFRETYMIAATINLAIAASSFALAAICPFQSEQPTAAQTRMGATAQAGPRISKRWFEVVLFTTGFVSLAMEVVWTRAFTFVLQTTVYAFATILATYLTATWIGSWLYRRGLRAGRLIPVEVVLGALCLFSLPPVL